MPGVNLTGQPNVDNYVLGRGRVYAATQTAAGLPEEFRDFGNAPQFNMTVTTETLDHQSSREGLRKVDKQFITSQKIEISFQLDETSDFDNLALFLSGTVAAGVTNPGASAINDGGAGTRVKVTPGADTAVGGRWYELRDANGVRAYDLTGTITIADAATAGNVHVIGTDYLLDTNMGMVFVVDGGGADGSALYWELASPSGSAAATFDEVKGLTQTNQILAVKFIRVNPGNNDFEEEFSFHSVNLKADGDLSGIGDEVAVMGFSGALEENTAADADSPYVTVRTHANAGTAS